MCLSSLNKQYPNLQASDEYSPLFMGHHKQIPPVSHLVLRRDTASARKVLRSAGSTNTDGVWMSGLGNVCSSSYHGTQGRNVKRVDHCGMRFQVPLANMHILWLKSNSKRYEQESRINHISRTKMLNMSSLYVMEKSAIKKET